MHSLNYFQKVCTVLLRKKKLIKPHADEVHPSDLEAGGRNITMQTGLPKTQGCERNVEMELLIMYHRYTEAKAKTVNNMEACLYNMHLYIDIYRTYCSKNSS